MLKWCFVLCELVTVTATLNVSYEDPGSSVCVRKILSRIAELKTFITDVSLINNEDDVVKQLQGIPRLRFNTRTQSWPNNTISNTIYVMNFKDYNDMKQGFAVTMNDYYWTPISNFLIILEHLEDNLNIITKFLLFNNLYNVTILSKEAHDYTIYTFQSPIHPCNHNSNLVRITPCSMYNGGSYIFPKIGNRDLRNCRFKLAAHNFYPMVNLDNNKSEGLEQRIVQFFSERHNIVIDLVEYYKIDNMGRIVGNYTYVDMLQMVRSNKVEGVFGGFFLDTGVVGKYFFAYPLLVDHMVLIMPRAIFFDLWQAVFHMAFYTIMFVFSLIILFSVLAYLLALFPSREPDVVRDFIIVFGYFLNKITVREMKKGVAETLIICSLLFSVFIIPFTMQAFLSSVKTHPIRGFEVKLLEDITEQYQLIVPQAWTKDLLIESSQDCVNRLDCLNKVMNSKDRMYYTIISELIFDTYQWMLKDKRCIPEVYKLRSPLYSLLRTVYFRSGSVLAKPFDKFMLKYVSGGLLQKHTKDLAFAERLKCTYRAKPLHEALSLNNMRQSFIVLICGYCLSAICFVCEVLTKTRQYRM